ncbi:uncharacterized protein [Anabrus simplex]|uniref:uncharacterized protein isoform X3 n=1 Tax=Anabrus simplex TaxID=316456 RepID=UPI0035A3AF41
MDEPLFVKCEPEWSAESCTLEPTVQLLAENLVEIKVEPDHMYDDDDEEEEDVKKATDKECNLEPALPNNFFNRCRGA